MTQLFFSGLLRFLFKAGLPWELHWRQSNRCFQRRQIIFSGRRGTAQYPVLLPNQSYKIVLDEIAVRDDSSFFTDHDVHKVLSRKKIKRLEGEWFECEISVVRAALIETRFQVRSATRFKDS